MTTKAASFSGCSKLAITNCVVDGDVASNLSAAANGFGFAQGLVVRGCSDTVIEGNELSKFYRGLSVTESQRVLVKGNDIHDMRMDGSCFAQVEDITIEGNHIHDFKGSPTSGDHCDMIQFWTTATTAPSRNVVIRDNVLDIGNGTATQSIFMRNELVDTRAAGAEMFYRNVVIEGNTITNAHLNGITVGETNGVTIRNNTLLHDDGAARDGADPEVEIPRINLASASTAVLIQKNVTTAVPSAAGHADWIVSDNVLVQVTDPQAPGYIGNLFAGSSLKLEDGIHHWVALQGGIIDQLNAGSALTQSAGAGLQPLFHVQHEDRATRIYDASLSTLNGADLPKGTTYSWTFGDGTTATGCKVSHNYTRGGDYTVQLTVKLPDGQTATEAVQEAVDHSKVLSLANGHFYAVDPASTADLGLEAKWTSDGLQLGGTTPSAQVARSQVADLADADDFTFQFKLDADRVGASGEVSRLQGCLVTKVTAAGELQVQIWDQTNVVRSLTTTGARLNAVAELDHRVMIDLDDGRLQVWIDGAKKGDMAFAGGVGGHSGYDTHNLFFGNPWGQASFNGDVTDVALTVGAGEYGATPATSLLAAEDTLVFTDAARAENLSLLSALSDLHWMI
nr:right-handed parallel beta-helix repeat-containing protein [Rubellimicrobium arenae]